MAKAPYANVDEGVANDVEVGVEAPGLDDGKHIADEAKANSKASRRNVDEGVVDDAEVFSESPRRNIGKSGVADYQS